MLSTVIDVQFAAMASPPEILFVCVHNAGRSQMAAGLVALRSGGAVRVRSAGSDPGEIVNPLAVEAMAELGVDLSSTMPMRLADEHVRAAGVVITMGCGDACPIYPGKRYEEWVVADPAQAVTLDEVRAIRDDIDGRVRQLLAELAPTKGGGGGFG
jgi:protein-tyrosine-phosphatase